MSGGGSTPIRSRAPRLPAPHPRARCEDAPRESVHRHRETVVRRLLDRGISPTTLTSLLPDFRPVIQRVIDGDGPGAP